MNDFVLINSFYVLSDEEALKTNLPKHIFVFGRFQEPYQGEDNLTHYRWVVVYVEVVTIAGKRYGKCGARCMGYEELTRVYSESN